MKFVEFIERALKSDSLTIQVNEWLQENGPINILYTTEYDAYHDGMYLGRRFKIFYMPT